MGIEKFLQNFNSTQVLKVVKSCKRAYIDASIYWRRIQQRDNMMTTSDDGFILSEEASMTRYFFQYLCNHFIVPQLTAETCQVEEISIIFDNKIARPALKHWRCMSRSDIASRNATTNNNDQERYVDWSEEKLKYYFTTCFSDLDRDIQQTISSETFYDRVKLKFAKLDADDGIYRDDYLQARQYSHINEGDDDDEKDLSSYLIDQRGETNIIKTSPCIIYTIDSDFLSFFPTTNYACIVDYGPFDTIKYARGMPSFNIPNSLILLNFECKITLPESIRNSRLELPKEFNHEWIRLCYIKCLGMISPNDYITIDMFSSSPDLFNQLFERALRQTSMFYRVDKKSSRKELSCVVALLFLFYMILQCLNNTRKRTPLVHNVLRTFVFKSTHDVSNQEKLQQFYKNSSREQVFFFYV